MYTELCRCMQPARWIVSGVVQKLLSWVFGLIHARLCGYGRWWMGSSDLVEINVILFCEIPHCAEVRAMSRLGERCTCALPYHVDLLPTPPGLQIRQHTMPDGP